MRRRKFIGTLAGGTSISLAGCIGDDIPHDYEAMILALGSDGEVYTEGTIEFPDDSHHVSSTAYVTLEETLFVKGEKNGIPISAEVMIERKLGNSADVGVRLIGTENWEGSKQASSWVEVAEDSHHQLARIEWNP